MSGGCSGEKTEIRKCFAPGLGCGGSGGGGGSREEAEEEAAATAARTRKKRRRCGFSYKMAGGDYLAEPTAPPTCSPAPGILGLVVSQRRPRSESLGRAGFRDRSSQRGVRGPAPAAGPRAVQVGAALPRRSPQVRVSSPRARRFSLDSPALALQWGRRGVSAGANRRQSP